MACPACLPHCKRATRQTSVGCWAEKRNNKETRRCCCNQVWTAPPSDCYCTRTTIRTTRVCGILCSHKSGRSTSSPCTNGSSLNRARTSPPPFPRRPTQRVLYFLLVLFASERSSPESDHLPACFPCWTAHSQGFVRFVVRLREVLR